MKKVALVVLAGLLLSFIVVSCTNETASEDQLYEQQAIDNGKIRDGDV